MRNTKIKCCNFAWKGAGYASISYRPGIAWWFRRPGLFVVLLRPKRKGAMNQERDREFISVDTSYLEEGDLLPVSVALSSSNDLLTDVEVAMCDGEGGSAPSKGTKWA